MSDPEDKDGPPRDHSLSDHSYGAFTGHMHGPGEFDHDHDEDFLPIDSRSLESVPLISMGLDVGSSGTQVVFSRLEMRGPGEIAALRGKLRTRETLYQSPISLTPFRDAATIDEDRLWAIVEAAFQASGLTPDDIETGAVILTGAAARRENARTITQRMSEELGELVCAVAGDHMEAQLAAYGSGAVEASRAGLGRRLLAMDIGGATTKFALIDDGKILDTAAFAVGGRQIALDTRQRITRLDPEGAAWAARAGFDWQIGDTVSKADLDVLAQAMADSLVSILTEWPVPTELLPLFITEPLGELGRLDGIMVSGGVAEYVHLRETRDFGDLGWRLGWALRRRFDAGAVPVPLLPPGECIRATALGASEHSVQITGRTIYISSHAELLPKRNLPVLRVDLDCSAAIDPAVVAQAIAHALNQFDFQDETSDLALAFAWRGDAEHMRVRALAEGIVTALQTRIAAAKPLYIVLDGDVALTLGAILKEELHVAGHVLVVDGLVLRNFDYVDIGRVRLPSHSVPVTIKSLVFGGVRATTKA
jgi:ethanolamine utilization protein EutA